MALVSSHSLAMAMAFISLVVRPPHPNLCVTVVNRGDVIDVRLTSSIINTACTLDPDKTSTCCAQSVSRIDVLCIETGCNGSGFYRVDLIQ